MPLFLPVLFFLNSCSVDQAANSFVCHPLALTWDETHQIFKKSPLGDVPLSVNLAAPDSYEPTLKGSTVDPLTRKVYWHAGCSSEYFVTDPESGQTQRFPLDPQALGVGSGDHGVCLIELAYDSNRGFVVALGGRILPGGTGTSVEFAARLNADGTSSLLSRLNVSPTFNYLHDYQTVSSFDPGDNTITAPIYTPGDPTSDGNRQWLSFNIETGALQFVKPGGSSVQNQFYDPVLKERLSFNCDLPGLTDLEGQTVLNFGHGALRDAGMPEPCHGGFVGAAFDPQSRVHYMIVHKGAVGSSGDPLFMATADVKAGTWNGLMNTDLTAGDLNWGRPGNDNFYETVEFVSE